MSYSHPDVAAVVLAAGMGKRMNSDLAKVLRSAVANAQQKETFGGDIERLYVAACYADQGPSTKRVRPAPMGRAYRVVKRTAHLTVRIGEQALAFYRATNRSDRALVGSATFNVAPDIAGGGTVLQWVDTPIAETSSRMGPLTTTLLQTHGAKWTHSLAINDLYFDFMGPALAAAGIDGKANPKAGSAGDGSEAAFQRIRTGQFQTVTVAEPLNLQGWQLVDELNRAVQGAPCSGYVTSPALVTEEGLKASGDSNQFDPQNGYRDAYAKMWGK